MTKFFELVIELIGWLQIMVSPFFICLTIALLGLIVGIILATKIFKSKKRRKPINL